MQETAFRKYLVSRGFDEPLVDSHVNLIQKIEDNLALLTPQWTLEDLNYSSTQSVIDEMIDRGDNTIENLQALVRYAYLIDNQDMFVTVFQHLDGCESMQNLHDKLSDLVGEDLRDVIFEEMPLPPLGLSLREKSRYTYRVMMRLEEIFEEKAVREVLNDSLRNLPDEYYLEARKDFYEICGGDIDRYLAL